MSKTPSPPRTWDDAFAALPLESPPAGAWQRIAPRLAPKPRRVRRVLPWAIAASTAVLAALPVLLLVRSGQPSDTPRIDAAPRSVASATAATTGTAPEPRGTSAAPAGAATGTIAAGRSTPSSATLPAHAAATPAEPGDPTLATLQEESARLETLLVHLSTNGPVDGAQLVLTLSLQAQVGEIDAALGSAALDDETRAGLWQRRVALLRELAAVASDQRWDALFADTGSRYALVQVY